MPDVTELKQFLKINDITKDTPRADVEQLFDAANYTPEEKKQALEFLDTSWWGNVPVSSPPQPPTPSFVASIPPSPAESNTSQTPLSVPRQPLMPPRTTPNIFPKQKRSYVAGLIGGIVIVVLIAGTAFAYVEKIGPFSVPALTENNFLSTILARITQIQSSKYQLSMNITVVPREADAVPFTLQEPDQGAIDQQYQNDYDRSNDVGILLGLLRQNSSPYPTSLQALASKMAKENSYYASEISIKDPSTQVPYQYSVAADGKNFQLTVTFETTDAIQAVQKSYGFSATSTSINGTTVTFTKDSSPYFFPSTTPPKPYFETLADYTSNLSPDTTISSTLTAESDWTKQGGAWSFNFDASGSLGDLTYKVNADALKTDNTYYVRVNNFPDVFFLNLSSIKGQWIKIPITASSSTATSTQTESSGSGDLLGIGSALPKLESSYTQNSAQASSFMKQAISVADSDNLIQFKDTPHKEKVNDRNLYRYDLDLQKGAILPFYQAMQTYATQHPSPQTSSLFNDEGFLQYLKSSAFDQTFDYYNKNTTLTLWTDTAGNPALVQYTIRVVPPDTATQLKYKEVEVSFELELSDINKPVSVAAPAGAKTFKEIQDSVTAAQANSPAVLNAKRALIQEDLESLRSQSALFYDQNNNSYGTKAFPLGECQQTPGTFFANSAIYSFIQSATNEGSSTATCVSSSDGSKINAYAVSVPVPDEQGYSFCVDSSGNVQQIVGSVKSAQCR